ncbi:MAG TPA: type II CAAX endopeptidase family protein [Clostridiales bacterium]|nr:type II CAAX endopeptidase family protein [Clostridiales bacterium]
MELYNDNLSNLENKGFRKPGIPMTGIVYSIVVTLFITIAYRVQHKNFYLGVLATEIILIMLPPLIALFIFKYDIKKVLRLNKIGVINLLLIFCIMVFSIPVVGAFNLANLWLVKYIFGKAVLVQPPIASGYGGLLLSVLVVGVSAGVCEEVLFRGFIQRGLEKFGAGTSILISAFLFSIMHVQFEKLFGTFLLGTLIGFIVYRTNSLYGGIFAHFVNNTIGVLVLFASSKLSEFAKLSGVEPATDVGQIFESFENMPLPQLIIIIVVWSFIILTCAAILAALVFALIKNTSKPQSAMASGNAGLFTFLPGIFIISSMYFLEGLMLKGVENSTAEFILRILGAK